MRYKGRLIIQDLSQRSGIDYEETYSPMIDATIFRYLICWAVSERLDIHVMDVVTTYLHGSFDNIYIYRYIWKSLKDFKCLKQLIQNIVIYTQLSYKDPCIN